MKDRMVYLVVGGALVLAGSRLSPESTAVAQDAPASAMVCSDGFAVGAGSIKKEAIQEWMIARYTAGARNFEQFGAQGTTQVICSW